MSSHTQSKAVTSDAASEYTIVGDDFSTYTKAEASPSAPKSPKRSLRDRLRDLKDGKDGASSSSSNIPKTDPSKSWEARATAMMFR